MNTAEKLARQVLDAFTTGDVAAVGDLVTEDFVDHGAPPWAPQGRAGYLAILTFLTTRLKIRYELHDLVADGDKVAVRATAHGVHDVDAFGFAPTGGRTRCRPCTSTAPRAACSPSTGASATS